MNMTEAWKKLVSNHRLLISLFFISILFIVIYPFESDFNLYAILSFGKAKFYNEVLFNLSMGYVVSFVFYLIVVYFPELKRKEQVKVKTHLLFGRINTAIHAYIIVALKAFNIYVERGENVKEVWVSKIDTFEEPIKHLENVGEFFDFGKDITTQYLDRIIQLNKKITHLRESLIPFLMFMDENEIDLYSELEDILIFEKNKDDFYVAATDHFFMQDLEYVIEAYFNFSKIFSKQPLPIFREKEDYCEVDND